MTHDFRFKYGHFLVCYETLIETSDFSWLSLISLGQEKGMDTTSLLVGGVRSPDSPISQSHDT